MRLIATSGNRFGSRSIPEFLGDRYQSEGIRVMVAIFSLVLFFYLAGQLVSGLVMFETMLGLTPFWALTITTLVLLFYVGLGGAHADILTDAVQGVMMLILALAVILLVLFGVGVEDGFLGVLERLKEQDTNLVAPLNPSTALYHSPWSIIAVLFAHIPLGLLPHLGNKLWALKEVGQQRAFIKLAFLFGLTLGMMGLGGLLARAMFGADLLAAADGVTPNQALPMLFIELFPTWLDRQVLNISRVATLGVLLACMAMAWALIGRNIALIVWIGNGGMMAAFAGPLVMGALWRGVTRRGAYAGLASGFFTFLILHTQLLDPDWFGPGVLHNVVAWVYGEGPNPFSCAAMGEAVSIFMTFVVSKLTQPLPKDHINKLFGSSSPT
jgi:Na+/proline symporter